MKSKILVDPKIVQFQNMPLQFSIHEPGRFSLCAKGELSLVFPDVDLSDIRIIPLFFKAGRSMVASDIETNKIRDCLLAAVRLPFSIEIAPYID